MIILAVIAFLLLTYVTFQVYKLRRKMKFQEDLLKAIKKELEN